MTHDTTVALVAAVVALAGATFTCADTILVPGDHTSIQGAIDAADDDDEIIVAPDTYNEAIDLLGKAIHLRSDAGAGTTIIDATGLATSVVTCANGETRDTILEGFTITGGAGTLDATRLRGGGMYNDGASPTVLDCVFTANVVVDGGGMFNRGDSRPLVRGCNFVDNVAYRDLMDGAGGGLMDDVGAGSTIVDCEFIGNSAGYGGACRLWQSDVVLVNCLFQDNEAVGDPGAWGGYGGALHLYSMAPGRMFNCAFVGNTATNSGGAVIVGQQLIEIGNCTFAENVADYDGPPIGGGALHVWGDAEAVVTNCVFWGDTSPHGPEIYLRTMATNSATVTVSFSDVEGGTAGVEVEPGSTLVWGHGNIDEDPAFVNAGGGDCRLGPRIARADAGHNWGVPVDWLDLDGDDFTGELIPFDLDGLPRFNADELDFDTGCGGPVVADMGDYEYQFDPVVQVLYADINGSGAVDVDDLLAVLGGWGQCSTTCCMPDLDRGGFVEVDDLLAVLGAWGP